jgi:hypothetical protein
MAKKTLPSEPQPVWGKCIPCGARFLAGYADDAVLSMCCQSCAASLFGAAVRSSTVLVPLPDATPPAPGDSAAPAVADSQPRPARMPRPRVRRVPLYEPLTSELRRRLRRDS